jgi:hypothetical protein
MLMDYHTGDPVLDERVGRLRFRRREQERAAAEIASDTSELLRRFAAQLSVGDAAVLLGVSKGRISQLRSGPGRSCRNARLTRPGSRDLPSVPARPTPSPSWTIRTTGDHPAGRTSHRPQLLKA